MIISDFRPPFAAFSLLLSMLLVTACGDETKEKKRPGSDHLVELKIAEVRPVSTRLSASGSLRAERNVRLYNEISAKVTRLPYYPGDHVETGEVLIELDDSIIRAELEKAVAQKAQAEADHERLKQLKPKNLASEEEIARARTALEVAAAEEKLQRTRLQLTRIKAPFSGIITERHVEPGDVVSMHDHILSMIDPSSIHLRVRLAERWIPYIDVGDEVEVTIDALGHTSHEGRISRIHPGINIATRKGTFEIEFGTLPEGIQPGQLAETSFRTRAVERLVVPAHSIHYDSNGAFLYTVNEEDKITKAYVTRGEQYDDLTAIDDGIDAGTRVVTKGFIGLRNGKQVKPVEPQVKTDRD